MRIISEFETQFKLGQSSLTQVLTKIIAIFSINEDQNILVNRK